MLDFLLTNDFLSAVIAFAIVLIPAVVIHELGHLFAAKAVGITVLEFGIGFPPRVAKLFNWGETEFTLNLLPLGGFVRPLGEDMIRPLSEAEVQRDREKLLEKLAQPMPDAERETKPTPDNPTNEREVLAARGITNPRSINEVKPLPRIFFMVGGVLANFASALIIFMVIGVLGVAQPIGAGVVIDATDANSSLAQAGIGVDYFIETVDGATVATARELFRVLAAKAGQEVTLSVTDLNTAETKAVLFTPDADDMQALAQADGLLVVRSVLTESPAAAAGIQPDDVIIAFAGEDLRAEEDPFGELQKLSQQQQGKAVSVAVLRGTETVTLSLTPRIDPPEGSGRLGVGLAPQFTAAALGITYREGGRFDYVPLPPLEAIQYGFTRTADVLGQIVAFPLRIIRGETRGEENRIVSVVGVSQLGGAVLQNSIAQNRPADLLEYIALISIALGFTNLLPIPALDGGRIVFALVEMLRGKPIAPEREGLIHLIGLAFLLSIGILFILNDIINPLTNLLP
ncbi:MAG: RIP metalloprotease RseP [Armatimonadetes bacterium]|nr:RIP metalloprotease RseP [Anaerolineae bacterium]